MKGRRDQSGFSLAELLLVLLILGNIATFTIPKVLSAQQSSQKEAVIKETIAALSEVTYIAMVTNDSELTPANFYDYYSTRINAVKLCDGDMDAQGCWDWDFGSPDAFQFHGFVMHNGAVLGSFNNCCDLSGDQEGNLITMDWNGADGPNIFGDDQFDLIISWGSETITAWPGETYKPGTVGPNQASAASVALFNEVFD